MMGDNGTREGRHKLGGRGFGPGWVGVGSSGGEGGDVQIEGGEVDVGDSSRIYGRRGGDAGPLQNPLFQKPY